MTNKKVNNQSYKDVVGRSLDVHASLEILRGCGSNQNTPNPLTFAPLQDSPIDILV